jgi:hypothetical protein
MSDLTPNRRFRFSLLNLFFLTTSIAFGVGLYSAHLRYRKYVAETSVVIATQEQKFVVLNAELQAMREEGGFLTITDKQKIHAIRLRNQQPLQEGEVWSYRVYLPPGQKYVVACQVKDLPTGNKEPSFGSKPNESTAGSGQTIYSVGTGLLPGEYLLSVALGLGEQGQWQYRFQISGKDSTGKRVGSGMGSDIFLDSENDWPAKSFSISTSGVIEQQLQHDPKRTLVLLDHRGFDGRSGGSSSDSTEGIMLWIEPNPNEPEAE